MKQAISDIQDERGRQDRKWGSNRNLRLDRWMIILGEEFGEVCKAILDEPIENVRKELVQVAAVACAAIECIDRNRNQ